MAGSDMPAPAMPGPETAAGAATPASGAATPAARLAAGGPRIEVGTVFAVIGVLAFAAGVTKAYVLEPLGDAFGDLSPDGKALVTALVVLAVIGVIAAARWRHRRTVLVARRVVDSAVGEA